MKERALAVLELLKEGDVFVVFDRGIKSIRFAIMDWPKELVK